MKFNRIERFLLHIKSIRFLLSTVTTISLVTGLVLLALGVIVLLEYNKYDLMIPDMYFVLPRFVIATAVMILVASVVGFYGAVSEKFHVIAVYVALLIPIFIFELAITVTAFNFSSDNVYTAEMHYLMANTLNRYGKIWDATAAWDNLHREFYCCGSYGFLWDNGQLPLSCCTPSFGQMSSFNCTTENAHTFDCPSYLIFHIQNYAFVIAFMTASVTGVQAIITAIAAWQAYRAKYITPYEPFDYDVHVDKKVVLS